MDLIIFSPICRFQKIEQIRQVVETGIRIYYAQSSKYKAAMVERLNFTLKRMIYSFITDRESYKFVPQLQDIVKSYNEKVHSSLPNISPMDAEKNYEKHAYNIRQMNELKYLKVKKAKVKHKINL